MAAVLRPAANVLAAKKKRRECGAVAAEPLPPGAWVADTGIMQVNYTLNLPLLAGGLGGQLID